MKTIGIIGAGASGLACVKTLLEKQDQLNILLFERNASIAKKIAATGNGHCNLSNSYLTIDAYQGDVSSDIYQMILDFDIESFCYDLGFLTRKQGTLYYPYSRQAKTVVKSFEKLIENDAVSLFLNTKITKIECNRQGYILVDDKFQRYPCDYIVVCAGGKAGSGFGTDGQIFDVLKPLGLSCVDLRPSLVSLVTKENTKKLKGTRFHGTFTLKNHGQTIASYKGEALFNDDGISGIACMQLSRFLEFNKPNQYTLHCNLIDELNEDLLEKHYEQFHDYEGIVQDKIAGYLNYRPVDTFTQFKERLENLSFNIVGTRDFTFAQVSKGGISLNELDNSLMVKKYPHMYLGGEVLNIDGDCGGYNLHFAFACGCKIGQEIIHSIESRKG